MATLVYHSGIEDIVEIGGILKSIGFEPSSTENPPYEFKKGQSVVMARFYDAEEVLPESRFKHGRIIAVDGSDEDIMGVSRVLPPDQSKNLDTYSKNEFIKELTEIKNSLSA